MFSQLQNIAHKKCSEICNSPTTERQQRGPMRRKEGALFAQIIFFIAGSVSQGAGKVLNGSTVFKPKRDPRRPRVKLGFNQSCNNSNAFGAQSPELREEHIMPKANTVLFLPAFFLYLPFYQKSYQESMGAGGAILCSCLRRKISSRRLRLPDPPREDLPDPPSPPQALN